MNSDDERDKRLEQRIITKCPQCPDKGLTVDHYVVIVSETDNGKGKVTTIQHYVTRLGTWYTRTVQQPMYKRDREGAAMTGITRKRRIESLGHFVVLKGASES
jgi:hypothetical protein